MQLSNPSLSIVGRKTFIKHERVPTGPVPWSYLCHNLSAFQDGKTLTTEKVIRQSLLTVKNIEGENETVYTKEIVSHEGEWFTYKGIQGESITRKGVEAVTFGPTSRITPDEEGGPVTTILTVEDSISAKFYYILRFHSIGDEKEGHPTLEKFVDVRNNSGYNLVNVQSLNVNCSPEIENRYCYRGESPKGDVSEELVIIKLDKIGTLEDGIEKRIKIGETEQPVITTTYQYTAGEKFVRANLEIKVNQNLYPGICLILDSKSEVITSTNLPYTARGQTCSVSLGPSAVVYPAKYRENVKKFSVDLINTLPTLAKISIFHRSNRYQEVVVDGHSTHSLTQALIESP